MIQFRLTVTYRLFWFLEDHVRYLYIAIIQRDNASSERPSCYQRLSIQSS